MAPKKSVKKAAKKAAKTAKKAVKKAVKKVAKKSVKKAAKKAVKVAPAKTGGSKEVTLEYFSPDSSMVYIAGTFTDWEMAPMSNNGKGNWTFTKNMQKGEHQYKYVFEGVSWEVDPTAPAISTEFGLNNLLVVK